MHTPNTLRHDSNEVQCLFDEEPVELKHSPKVIPSSNNTVRHIFATAKKLFAPAVEAESLVFRITSWHDEERYTAQFDMGDIDMQPLVRLLADCQGHSYSTRPARHYKGAALTWGGPLASYLLVSK